VSYEDKVAFEFSSVSSSGTIMLLLVEASEVERGLEILNPLAFDESCFFKLENMSS
jgi:hypothetical protein